MAGADASPLPPFSGVVLAGGRSTRMGTDKALVEVDGRPLVAVVASVLEVAGAAEVFVVGGNAARLADLGLRTVPDDRPVLVDCLTLWLSNHMLAEHDVDVLSAELEGMLAAPRGPWFVVTNEVGLGIVPDNPLGRRFRDAQGRLNQRIAATATRVLFMVAGLPMQVK